SRKRMANPFPLTPPSPSGRGRTCECFVNDGGMLASIPRTEARRQRSQPTPARPNALAHSALPDEPSGSPSPRGRGRGEGEGFVRFSIAFSILQVALIPIFARALVIRPRLVVVCLRNERQRGGECNGSVQG